MFPEVSERQQLPLGIWKLWRQKVRSSLIYKSDYIDMAYHNGLPSGRHGMWDSFMIPDDWLGPTTNAGWMQMWQYWRESWALWWSNTTWLCVLCLLAKKLGIPVVLNIDGRRHLAAAMVHAMAFATFGSRFGCWSLPPGGFSESTMNSLMPESGIRMLKFWVIRLRMWQQSCHRVISSPVEGWFGPVDLRNWERQQPHINLG